MVGEVVEVSLADGKARIERIVCVVDCGIAVNPDVVRMQAESAIVYALSAALHGEITIAEGAVVQYRVVPGRAGRWEATELVDAP